MRRLPLPILLLAALLLAGCEKSVHEAAADRPGPALASALPHAAAVPG